MQKARIDGSQHGLPMVVREKDAEKERKLITDYRELVDLVTTKVGRATPSHSFSVETDILEMREKQYTVEVLALTSKLLKKNPEYYTIWNHRRLILSHLLLLDPSDGESEVSKLQSNEDILRNDLQFLIPLLKEFPKCYWIWNYRLWLLEQGESRLLNERATKFWQEELGLVSMMLSRDERNFHGWDYRRRVVSHLERLSGKSMADSEFAYSSKMIRKALQNFSALHYRGKLIPRLLDERDADSSERRQMLNSELDLMQEALIDPYNQSAWFYHQFLMSTIVPSCPREFTIVLDLDEEDRLVFYDQELDRIREMLEDFDDCKWIYQALIQYTIEYQELKGGNMDAFSSELRHWLSELQRLDPMRSGRWQDMQQNLKL
jgi:geranylgeranyl transferase type-2 subunit alpha